MAAFCAWIGPTEAELHMRADITARYSNLVTRLYPAAQAAAFGSTRTSLFLPVSDVDLVILGRAPGPDPLNKLASILKASGVAREVNYISHARVPIIKFTDRHSNCCVDICLNQHSGISSSRLLSKYLNEMTALRPLVLVLKYFLYQHGYGETYTGGIGSYCIVLMMVSYLQVRRLSRYAHTT